MAPTGRLNLLQGMVPHALLEVQEMILMEYLKPIVEKKTLLIPGMPGNGLCATLGPLPQISELQHVGFDDLARYWYQLATPCLFFNLNHNMSATE